MARRTINEGVLEGYQKMLDQDIQLIWQTGKFYFEQIKTQVQENNHIKILAFVDKMEAAFSLADVVISRAGASSISEMAMLKKAAIFVPSPNVSEDHQTKNAMALVKEGAAVMVKDEEVKQKLVDEVINLVKDEEGCEVLKQNVIKFAKPNAANEIVDELLKLV